VRRIIVLHSVNGSRPDLDDMVQGWIAENVGAICVLGRDCEDIHFQIDLIISDHQMRNSAAAHIATTSHEESLEDAIEFARTYNGTEPVVIEL
jgi:hypothetical protein